uniref:Niban apoptosis regulator 1 n=1 Tax=Anser brachyrhynchus TaxID=132585 RepID=A0A8B9I1K4_9AVES
MWVCSTHPFRFPSGSSACKFVEEVQGECRSFPICLRKTEAVIKNFSPHYKRQYTVAFCKHVQDELEQHRDSQSQFLKTKPKAEAGTVLYETELLHFVEDLKKWKDRYVVIKNDYTVDCFETKEAYLKGLSPKYHIVPAGGKVLTSEEDYNLLSDKHFPDPVGSSEKEVAQAFVQLPREFPVYLWQPFARHSYFCFQEPEAQRQFSAVLNDCVRHSNHDFLKQTTYEVEAFLEAVQFFRQEKGHYGTWEMITGNEKEILSNLVMEELLPNLQTMILPKMKGKRNDRKRAWFAFVEETYGLVQQQVSEGLSTLKEECRDFAKSLEGTIRSDMDQILNSKNFLAGKIKATVSEPAQKCCTENIQPFLTSILEELMGPVSSGFTEVRSLFDKEVNEIIQNFQKTNDITKLKENVDQLMNLPLSSVKMEPCYLKVNLLQELLQDLKSRFKVYHIDFVVQRTQNFMQELMENAVYTFEQLFSPSRQADSAKVATTIEKVKLRVLKQYDYDSSTIRKKIFQEALVQITLPTMQKTLASTCKPELQKYEQFIFADYTSVIQVENVYEEILYQTLLEETLKVIKEAAILKKHNLFEDNLNLPCESVSSLTDLKTPSGSAQTTPAKKPSTARVEMSDTDTQSEETLIVTEKISWEKDHDDSKPSDKEAVISVNTAGNQASKNEEVITDISEKQESLAATLTKQKRARGTPGAVVRPRRAAPPPPPILLSTSPLAPAAVTWPPAPSRRRGPLPLARRGGAEPGSGGARPFPWLRRGRAGPGRAPPPGAAAAAPPGAGWAGAGPGPSGSGRAAAAMSGAAGCRGGGGGGGGGGERGPRWRRPWRLLALGLLSASSVLAAAPGAGAMSKEEKRRLG